MTHRALRWLALGVLPLAACSLQPTYQRPPLPVPAALPSGGVYPNAQATSALPAVHYQEVFTDSRLQHLIEAALANNRDLRVAAANVARYRALFQVQRGRELPELDASLGASQSNRGPAGGSGAGTAGNAGAANGAAGSTSTTASSGSSLRSYSATLGTTAFELDLFGRVRSLSDAALNQYFATDAAAQATRVALVSDLANAWLTYAADKSLLEVARQTAAAADNSVSLTRRRLEGGVAPRVDLRQAETVLATAQSDLAQQKTAVEQDLSAIELLVGSRVDPAWLPESIEAAAASMKALPTGVDSSVLLRRPDIAEAEYNLRAANAQIGAARAALFPRISLTALVGVASTSLDTLFASGSSFYQVSPSATLPIFQWGAGQANVEASKAQRDALIAAYEKSIQTAFSEVRNALARQGTIDEQLAADRLRLDATQDTFELSTARYRGGIDSFLQLLDAQRSLYAAKRQLAQTQRITGANRVAVYRALGGDVLPDPHASSP